MTASRRVQTSRIAGAAAAYRRRRRRLLAWVAFGVVGVLLGAVYAVGFSTSAGSTGANTSASNVVGTAPGSPPPSQYADTVTSSALEGLQIDFNGAWGKISADRSMFKVDLTGKTGTFFVDFLLTNTPTGWEALQLEFAKVSIDGTPTDCDNSVDFSTPDSSDVVPIETVDAHVGFGGLAGGSVYCFGIADATPTAQDADGTFIRKPSVNSAVTAPNFMAIVNRTA